VSKANEEEKKMEKVPKYTRVPRGFQPIAQDGWRVVRCTLVDGGTSLDIEYRPIAGWLLVSDVLVDDSGNIIDERPEHHWPVYPVAIAEDEGSEDVDESWCLYRAVLGPGEKLPAESHIITALRARERRRFA
jgi:hypothetical protein